MRGRGRTSETDKGLMDPLWEFILDDHDDSVVAEEGSGWRKERTQRGRRQEVERETGFFDGLFSCESDYTDESQDDNRDDGNNKRMKGIKETKRRNQKKEDSDVDNSMWDFFGASRQVSKKSTTDTTKNAKRSANTTKTIKTIKTPLKTTRKVANAKKETVQASDKPVKKGGLFGRLRRKEKAVEAFKTVPKPDDSVKAEYSEKDSKSVSVHANGIAPSSGVSPTPNSILKSPEKKESDNSSDQDDQLDAFRLFVEMVEALDPFATDDSDTESLLTEFESPEAENMREARDASNIDQLVEQARNDSNVVEIRLNFKPVAEETFDDEEDRSQSQGVTRVRVGNPYKFEDNSIAESEISGEDRNMDSPGTASVAQNDPIVQEEQHLDETSPGLLTPTSGAPSKTSDSQLQKRVSDNKGGRPLGLKRLVCCSVKNDDHIPLTKAQASSAPVLSMPATRMVPDNESDDQQVFDACSAERRSVGGISTSGGTASQGPHSVYAYDYDSQENLDVFYSGMGFNPKSSMVVRKLGDLPSVTPSDVHDEVIVKVEASTVSETDCIIRQGLWWGAKSVPTANTPGVEMVGNIYGIKPEVASKHDLEESQTVMSLTQCGGNARFMTIDPTKLVKVPPTIDPAQAACLPETYLTAFQVLHLDQNYKTRYERSSLRGKSVLIVGSMSNNMGKAIIELALNAGVANIYATAKQKHWKTLVNFGIMPLSTNPEEWIDRVEGTIDLVLASNGGLREDVTPTHFRALNPKTGKLIMCGRRIVGNDIPTGSSDQGPASVVCAKNKEQVKMLNRSHNFDIFEQWEKNLELCKRDLVHLLDLVQNGAIKPKILDRIPLSKVARAHELLESKRLSGFLICEPWMQGKKRAVYI